MKSFKPLITSLLVIGFLTCTFSLFAQGGYTLSRFALSPRSPASLNHNQRVTIAFNYTIPTTTGVYIWAQPMSGNSPSPGQVFEASPLITKPLDRISRHFTITKGHVIVTQVRIQIYNKAKTKVLYQRFVPVSYRFPKPPQPSYSITNIKMSPQSPTAIAHKQKVNITFNYYSSTKDVFIWARPMSGSSTTPGYAASPSKLHPAGSGSSSQYFMINSGKGVVDKVRFQIYNKDKTKLLYQKFVKVSYRFPRITPVVRYSISNIKMSPASPAAIAHKQKVNITFNYYSSTKDVFIWARPMSGSSTTPGYAASPSKLHPAGSGSSSQYFMINSGKGVVDKVRFQIYNKDKTKLLYKKFVSVKYTFPKVSTTTPSPDVKTPKRFFLDFKDAYIVYTTKSNSIQIAAEMNVLSYGADWQKKKLKPFLFHLKRNRWNNLYWVINTSRKEVYLRQGPNFGRISNDSSKTTTIKVDVVGSKEAPTRFFMRFSSSYLVFRPSDKVFQIAAHGVVIDRGEEWKKCQLKPYLYHFKKNSWSFFWKANTSRKAAWRVKGGNFCGLGGSETKLKASVRVVY